MNNIVSCNFNYSVNKESNNATKTLCILQPMYGSANLKTNEKMYSLIKGSLYFINNDMDYEIGAVDDNYKQNKIVISQQYIKALSDLLDFNKEIDQIFFENKITFIPLKNYKSIVSRFKRIYNTIEKQEPYAKAKITSDLLALINYAVYSIYH